MKKLLSLVLALVLCLSTALPACADNSSGNVEIVFDSADKMSFFSGANYLYVTYNSSENAMQFSTAGWNDPYVYFDLASLAAVNGTTHKYAVLTYRTPTTNSSGAGPAQFFWLFGGSAISENSSLWMQPENGYKYRSVVLDMSNFAFWNGSLDRIRIDPFRTGATPWDTFFLSSIVFCTNAAAAQQAASEQAARANGNINSMSDANLNGSYGASMTPVWSGSISYNESVFISDAKTDREITLAYDIGRVLSVRDSTLNTEYKYGRDYDVQNGKLIVKSAANGGTIPAASDSLWFHSGQNYGLPGKWYQTVNGDYTFVEDEGKFQANQISVTYTHTGGFPGSVPGTKLDQLPYAAYRLNNGINENIVFFGDSITYGCSPSSLMGTAPYCPNWVNLTAAALNAAYANNVSYVNKGVGGTDSVWGAQNVSSVTACNPDLVVLAFGMNDLPGGRSAAAFKANIKSIIDQVRAAHPLCEFLLVSSMLPNPQIVASAWSGMNAYLGVLSELAAEYEGVAVADVTSVHEALLSRKDFVDMTSNGINHNNDYFTRVYAQIMVAALTGEVDLIDPGTVPLATQTSADVVYAADRKTSIASYGNNNAKGTELGSISHEAIAVYGWLASSRPISRFGYRYGDEVVLNSQKAATEAPVVSAGAAVAGLFGETSRFMIDIPIRSDANEVYAVAELSDGTVVDVWRLLYTSLNGPSQLLDRGFNTISLDSTALCNESDAEDWLRSNPIAFDPGAHQKLGLRGWALLNKSITGFAYRLDGGALVNGDYLELRQDVKSAVGSNAEGFLLFIDIDTLPAGEHCFEVLALAPDGGQFVVATVPLTVNGTEDPDPDDPDPDDPDPGDPDPGDPEPGEPDPGDPNPEDPEPEDPGAVVLKNYSFNTIYLDVTMLCDTGDAAGWTVQHPISFVEGSYSMLTMRGWAWLSSRIVGYGYRLDDGGTVSGNYFEDRKDVKAAIDPAAEGYFISADLIGLGVGEHRMDAVAIAEDGSEVVAGSVSFTITSNRAELLDHSFNTIYIDNVLICDTGDAAAFLEENPIVFAQGSRQAIAFRGWALTNQKITGFAYSLDNGVLNGGSFIEARQDVKEIIGEDAEGFCILTMLNTLPAGEHSYTVHAITAQGQTVPVCSFKVTVT